MNLKNFKRTQSLLYINSNQFTLYLFKSIQSHFKSISSLIQINSISLQINLKVYFFKSLLITSNLVKPQNQSKLTKTELHRRTQVNILDWL